MNKLLCVDSRLEETSRDLQQTKQKLSQEEFICSELTSVQETLYNTAGQVPTRFTNDLTMKCDSLLYMTGGRVFKCCTGVFMLWHFVTIFSY